MNFYILKCLRLLVNKSVIKMYSQNVRSNSILTAHKKIVINDFCYFYTTSITNLHIIIACIIFLLVLSFRDE